MENQIILDCESFSSSLKSLEEIYSSSSSEIIGYLGSVNLEEIFKTNKPKDSYGYDYLFECFERRFKTEIKEFEAYCFHTTRIRKGTKFSNGILPLNQVIDKIEEFIDKIAFDLGLEIIKIELTKDNMIGLKLRNDDSPWGIFIKDWAFELASGIHNYLKFPEIVEDIINFKYPNDCSVLLKEYSQRTVPCIVKFKVPNIIKRERLPLLIYYLYHKVNKLEMEFDCAFNYSNQGFKIDKENIEKIEYFESKLNCDIKLKINRD